MAPAYRRQAGRGVKPAGVLADQECMAPQNRLQALFDLSRTLSSSLDLGEVLGSSPIVPPS